MKDWKLVLVGAGIALAGMIVGASLFGAQPAAAQRTYTQCFIGIQEVVDIDGSGTVHLPESSRSVNVPSGWDVVSGGGIHPGGAGGFLFCR